MARKGPLAGTGRRALYVFSPWEGGPEMVLFMRVMEELAALALASNAPPDADEVIDLITVLERAASDVERESGRRPTHLVLPSEIGEQVERVAEAFPGVFGEASHQFTRPACIQRPGSEWIGQLSGIDLYAFAKPITEFGKDRDG